MGFHLMNVGNWLISRCLNLDWVLDWMIDSDQETKFRSCMPKQSLMTHSPLAKL